MNHQNTTILDHFCVHPSATPTVRWLLSHPLPGPLLITGVSSIGKKTLARWIARNQLCLGDHTAKCSCESCIAIEKGIQNDLISITPTGLSISIEAIRSLREASSYSASSSRGKVILITDSDYLTIEAGNALLKSIEECNPAVQWILTAAHTLRLPPTLRSRLNHIHLPRVPDHRIVDWSKNVLQFSHPEPHLAFIVGRPGILKRIVDADPSAVSLDETVGSLMQSEVIDQEQLNESSVDLHDTLRQYQEQIQRNIMRLNGDIHKNLQLLKLLDEANAAGARHQSPEKIAQYVNLQQSSI